MNRGFVSGREQDYSVVLLDFSTGKCLLVLYCLNLSLICVAALVKVTF